MKLLLMIFITIFSLQASTKQQCIRNFDKIECGNFEILDKIIIKSELNKKELSLKLKKDVSQIAFLGDTNLYTIGSKEAIKESEILSKLDFIIYAQPDINQRKEFAKKDIQKDIYSNSKLQSLWTKTKGKGVNIAIIDDGFDMSHKDLNQTNLIFAYDVSNKKLSAMPMTKEDTHGTQVAGIIFASHNGMGVDGIAPEASFIAIRQPYNTTSQTILAFTLAMMAKADIINCSWNSPHLLEPVYDVINNCTKDISVVFSAGNNGKELKKNKTEASIDSVITVGNNEKYSNYGSLVDIKTYSSAYTTKVGGEYGVFFGTSASAPIVTGLLALYISSGMSAKEAIKIIKKINH